MTCTFMEFMDLCPRIGIFFLKDEMQVLVFKYFLRSHAVSAKLCRNVCVIALTGSVGEFQRNESPG